MVMAKAESEEQARLTQAKLVGNKPATGAVSDWDRVVVPRSLRREVLEGLHAGHQCVGGMKARSAHSVFWP